MSTSIFDVSGSNGAVGISGLDRGHTTAPTGTDGQRGGHGSPGRPGTAAGSIVLQLSTPESTRLIPPNVILAQPTDSDVMVDTSMVYSAGDSKKLDTIMKIDADDAIRLYAKGGNGGRGGDGGDGQNGGTGIRGMDATEYSHGTNGGPGGDGGDGGNAGAGGDGASGGTIRLVVGRADTYLLMLYGHSNVSGGTGGPPGKPGVGGSGGRGGRGGSSYTYSVRRGDSIVWYTNSGGLSGRRGWPGNTGAFASPGVNGPHGTFVIVVPEGTTNALYKSVFDLSLVDVKIAPGKEDGVIEPGSRVFVSSIEIENVGGMPTPTSRSILAYIRPVEPQQPTLAGDNWVISEGFQRFVQLPQGLEPEDVAVVPCASFAHRSDGTVMGAINTAGEYLAFRVAPIDPVLALSSRTNRHHRGEPFHVTSSLIIRAQMTPFGRDFATFVEPKPFDICYPVQMSSIACLACLPPGGDTLVKFTVKNISLKDYGRDGEMGRVVLVKIAYDDGDLDPSNLTFVPIVDGTPLNPIVFNPDASGLPPSYEGQSVWLLPRLPAGVTAALSGRLSVSQDSEPYTAANFSISLLLGEIDSPLNAVTIQNRQIGMRVSKVYKKTPKSATLLVVNSQTTQAEIKAWEDLAEWFFGVKKAAACVDLWDVSQEGHFDLRRVVRSDKNLCEDWEDSTVIILDNPFDNFATRTANEPDDRALNYLNQDQLVGAVLSHGVHFCVVSPLLENSTAQRQHLASPRKALDFTSSMAFETFRELLDPFAIELSSFVVYGCSTDFIAKEIDVHADGAPMPKKFTLPWSAKPMPPIGDIYLGAADRGQIPNATMYTHVEHVILVKRATPFKSLKKITKLAASLQKQLLRKHPTRRYAMSTCTVGELGHLTAGTNFVMPPRTQAAIRVRRLLDVSSLATRITLTASPASPVDTRAASQGASTIHTPSFLKSPQIISAFLQSIPFRRRIGLYTEVLTVLDVSHSTNDEWRAGVLRASILADLACEQAVLRMKKRCHGVTEGSVTMLLPRLSTLCAIELPPLPMESGGRAHLLRLLAELTAYMKCKASWYEPLLPSRRSRQVTKMSNVLINGLVSRVFSSGSQTKKRVDAATSQTLKQWKTDVQRLRQSLKKDRQTNQAVNLRGRAFAAVLGTVAGGKIKWCEETAHRASSTAGGVCTEFGLFFTPQSFSAGGPYGGGVSGPLAKATVAGNVGLGSVTPNAAASQVARSATIRRNSISSRMIANRRATRELSSSAPIESGDESDEKFED